MSPAAKSLLAFGCYLAILGLLLLIVPNFLLTLFGFEPTKEVWIRIVGILLIILSYYDIRASKKELTDFFRWSVHVRIPIVFLFILFVLLGFVSPMLILFGVIDFLFALWTALALRSAK